MARTKQRSGGHGISRPGRCFVWLSAGLLLLAAWGAVGCRTGQETATASGAKDKDKVVFWYVGTGEAFCYDTGSGEQLIPLFDRIFEERHQEFDLEFVPSLYLLYNSSQGVEIIDDYLKKFKAESGGPGAKMRMGDPDFAFIDFGLHNIWNLHGNPMLDDEEKTKDVQALKQAVAKMDAYGRGAFEDKIEAEYYPVKKVSDLKAVQRYKYQDKLVEEGWFVFFTNFIEPFLEEWIESDLLAIAQKLREAGIKPALLTYAMEDFLELNDMIRRIGQKHDILVIDLETPTEYYMSQAMVVPEAKAMVLNEKGREYIVTKFLDQFDAAYNEEAIGQIVGPRQR